MKNFRNLLDIKLLSQSFDPMQKAEIDLDEAKAIALFYSKFDNCISVLSDLKMQRSYVYYGVTADKIGLKQKQAELDSIWEEELFSRVHPEDLQKKFRLELQYFEQLKNILPAERPNYEVITRLRVRGKAGKYIFLKHRLMYISSMPDGSAWLALCLYSLIPDYAGFSVPEGVILNNQTGTVLASKEDTDIRTLSAREKQVINLIKHGHNSKEIACCLSLSLNTISRHRQNILQKLKAANSLEACKIAEASGMI